jgi:hypothetical protein
MDVRAFLANEPYDNVVRTLASLSASADPSSIEQLKEFLKIRDDDLMGKHITPRVVCSALLHKGPSGIEALVAVLPDAPGAIYPQSIIETIWNASEGRIPKSSFVGEMSLVPPLDSPLDAATIESARKALDELVTQSLESEDIFVPLISFLSHQSTSLYSDSPDDKRRFRSRVFDSFAKGKIRITEALLVQFDSLIKREESEERYQNFLTMHPVFLDPLAAKVIPKSRLGSDHVTDFAIRRLDNKYVLVEIEKPHDPIFTASDDFSAKFTHALGQILDFQQWVDSHGEYARSLLPEISSPRGLLVMGRAANLSAEQRRKLHRLNMTLSSIEVFTFDEIASSARRLYENIYLQ